MYTCLIGVRQEIINNVLMLRYIKNVNLPPQIGRKSTFALLFVCIPCLRHYSLAYSVNRQKNNFYVRKLTPFNM